MCKQCIMPVILYKMPFKCVVCTGSTSVCSVYCIYVQHSILNRNRKFFSLINVCALAYVHYS